MSKLFRSIWWLACVGVALMITVACAPVTAPAPSSPASSSAITDIVWEWTSVSNRSTGQSMQVANPQVYTLILRDAGTLSGQADCNTFTGTYSQEGGFFITAQPDVMATCGGELR